MQPRAVSNNLNGAAGFPGAVHVYATSDIKGRMQSLRGKSIGKKAAQKKNLHMQRGANYITKQEEPGKKITDYTDGFEAQLATQNCKQNMETLVDNRFLFVVICHRLQHRRLDQAHQASHKLARLR